ncbi:ABC transporter ATP-binding protein [Bordetella petrii]|uniref:ABC transporter ATP-binding protein n=1 Tax=Bordetella petrii TaxID=94624 RepID=UPI001A95C01F|nr:ABC transporter ATP-binding protein [Bordetella petrii]MBO1110505.1 ABC transporter ATP-binding protein [Bordetella petrii]
MARKKIDFRGQAFKDVLSFTFRYWRAQPWRIASIVALVLLSAGADVLTPLFVGRLIDAVSAGVIDGTAGRAFWTLAALGLASTALMLLVYYSMITLTLKMMSAISARAFHHVQHLSTDWHANNFAGATVRKITRGMWALSLLNDTLLVALLPSVAMLAGATLVLGVHWPMMGAVVGVGSLVYVLITAGLSLGFVAPAARLGNAWDTRLMGDLADALNCNPVVKAFGAEQREEVQLAWTLDKWRRRTRRSWTRGSVNGGVQGVMLAIMLVAILGSALWLWSRGRASVGDITFSLSMFFILQGYLRSIGLHIRNLQRSVNDMEELVSLHAQRLDVQDRPGAGPITVSRGEICFEHVTLRYGAHLTPLFDDFSVRIAPGERVGLVGHSGSGKTTFIKLIQRLYDINGGRITIDGQDISAVQQASLRSQIAIVQQEPILFHRTLAENIAYARPGASRAHVMQAARLASAHDFIMALPNGYETLVGERGVKLSGGERQRVAIARAFLANAPILILDEATASLDSESEALVQEAMERLMAGRTTLVVAHRLSTVRTMDRLLVLDKGRIAEEGSHAILVRRAGGLYRRLLERQALDLAQGLEDLPEAAPRPAQHPPPEPVRVMAPP